MSSKFLLAVCVSSAFHFLALFVVYLFEYCLRSLLLSVKFVKNKLHITEKLRYRMR